MLTLRSRLFIEKNTSSEYVSDLSKEDLRQVKLPDGHFDISALCKNAIFIAKRFKKYSANKIKQERKVRVPGF